MNVYDIAIARALSSGGGGGGGSDFTTAKVTVVNSDINCIFAFCYDVPPEYGLPVSGMIYNVNGPLEDGLYNVPLDVPLYKGGAIAGFNVRNGSVSVSGNAIELGDDMCIITGDCTVTSS